MSKSFGELSRQMDEGFLDRVGRMVGAAACRSDSEAALASLERWRQGLEKDKDPKAKQLASYINKMIALLRLQAGTGEKTPLPAK